MKLFVATYDAPDSTGARTKYIFARSLSEADRKACREDRMLMAVDEASAAAVLAPASSTAH